MRTISYKYRKSTLLVISIVLMMCSCKDSKIAKDMEGMWKRSYVTSYEDGTKSHVDEQISFQYDVSDNEKDGGTFVEMCTGLEETDEDEINAKYRWVSKIEGTWKIELGTLYQHYNLSTLEVEIGKDDVDLKIKDEAWLWNDWGNLLTAGLYAKQTIHENLKKETYKELFRAYKRLNNQTSQDIGFPNVQINGSVMSYETGDMGKVQFYRIKERKTPKNNRRYDAVDKPTSESEENNDNVPLKLSVKNVEYWNDVEEQGTNTYKPENMIDGNPATAWAVNLDKASFDNDKLYGSIFTLNCSKLSHVIIRNGYAKSQEIYSNNTRALRVIFCNADYVSGEDEAASYLYEGILEDSPDLQTLEIASDTPGNHNIRKVQMIFPIDGLRHGTKWNDLCVSEIEFYGFK